MEVFILFEETYEGGNGENYGRDSRQDNFEYIEKGIEDLVKNGYFCNVNVGNTATKEEGIVGVILTRIPIIHGALEQLDH